MHRLGASIRIELNPDSDHPQVLLDLPHWDFDWQETYTFVEPIPISEGDTLRIVCSWDNSRGIERVSSPRGPLSTWADTLRSLSGVERALAHDELNTSPFRYVTWGEGTRDEMCLAGVIVIPSPAYYGVTLTDGGDEDLTSIMIGITWMRLLSNPGLLLLGVSAFTILIVAAGVVIRRYRHRQVEIRSRAGASLS